MIGQNLQLFIKKQKATQLISKYVKTTWDNTFKFNGLLFRIFTIFCEPATLSLKYLVGDMKVHLGFCLNL